MKEAKKGQILKGETQIWRIKKFINLVLNTITEVDANMRRWP